MKNMTNYDVERLLYKAAGYDDFMLYLMHELDRLEAEKASATFLTLEYIEITAKIETLKEMKAAYQAVKRTGKLPDAIEKRIELEDEYVEEEI